MRFILGRIFGQTFRFRSSLSYGESLSRFDKGLCNVSVKDMRPYTDQDVSVEREEEGQARFTITLRASYVEVGIYGWLIEKDWQNTLVRGNSFVGPGIVLLYLSGVPIGIMCMVLVISTKNLIFLIGGIGSMLVGLESYVRFIKAPLSTLIAILEEELGV